jgi:lipoprotein-anchoring transpeptidase ErfK/SrfK
MRRLRRQHSSTNGGSFIVRALVCAVGLGLLLPAAPAAAATVPGAPTITSVADVSTGQVNVSYSAPVDDGASPITGYEVTITGGASWLPCPVDPPGQCRVSGLTPGTSTTFRLRAINAIGTGPASAVATMTPLAPPGPDPDKPAVLPSPRVLARATFNAASNGLRVDWGSDRLGVGTLPMVTFNRDIPQKAPAERHLLVQARNDVTGATAFVAGAWGWVSNRKAVFRPKTYWPGNSTITVSSSLNGVVMGKKGSKWVVGAPSMNRSWSFRTARKLIVKVDGAKRRMTVSIDGKKVKTFGVSLGKNEWETRNGIKVIGGDKLADKTYTSQALNITDPNEQYSLDAKWNTRLTPTGEFIHAAPWAYGRIGRWNGSHGCTNMFEQDAKWIYDKTIPGDPVVYANTSGTYMEPWNGPGGLWNIPWERWLTRSALSSPNGVPVTTSPFIRTGPVTSASA